MAYQYRGHPKPPKPPVPAEKREQPPIDDTLCGTLSGYKRHYRAKTKACLPCRAANSEACRQRYQNLKAAT